MGLLSDLTGISFLNTQKAAMSKPVGLPASNKINVRNGSFNAAGLTRFDMEKQLRGIVKDPNIRQQMVQGLWDSRGGSGISHAEVKNMIKKMRNEGKINKFQANHYYKDLGVYN